MFSNEGRSIEQETLEYGWLIEVQLGKLSGRLTTPHLENIVTSCETFLILVLDVENSLRSPYSFLLCHHGNNQFECPLMASDCTSGESGNNSAGDEGTCDGTRSPANTPMSENRVLVDPKPIRLCPSSEEIKYKMVRVSVDAIDIYIVEAGTALSLWVGNVYNVLLVISV